MSETSRGRIAPNLQKRVRELEAELINVRKILAEAEAYWEPRAEKAEREYGLLLKASAAWQDSEAFATIGRLQLEAIEREARIVELEGYIGEIPSIAAKRGWNVHTTDAERAREREG